MKQIGENFIFKSKDQKEKSKQKYHMCLQKAKILYFNSETFNKKSIRKNSELLSDFNIFKIKKKNNVKYQRISQGTEKKNLKKITQQIIKLFHDCQNEQFNLEQISSSLNIDKRKIYDIVNVLNTIEIIQKISKGVYQWKNIQDSYNYFSKVQKFSKVLQQIQEEKSIGVLTNCFVSGCINQDQVYLDDLTQQIEKNSDQTKNKSRKLLDIGKILSSLGLFTLKEEDKRIIFSWIGLQNFTNEIEKILNCYKIDIKNITDSRKHRLNSEIFNTLTKAIQDHNMQPKNINLKRRTSSFDPSTVDQYLENDELVLPNFKMADINQFLIIIFQIRSKYQIIQYEQN